MLLDLIAGIAVVVWGVKTNGWYFAEISAIFLIMGIVAAIIMRNGLDEIGNHFASGFQDACTACMMIGIARATLIVLQEGNIIDTVVYGLSPAAVPPADLAQRYLHADHADGSELLFIPSGSGQGCRFHADHGADGRPAWNYA